MQEAVLSPLATWQNFYTIIGSAAATLTGLLFVVITLTAGVRVRVSSPSSGIAVFNTQNVVHFGAALLVAAILSAPWQALWTAGLLLGLAGLGGATYVVIALWRARRLQMDYQPVLEDWLWYMVLPLVSYTALVVAAIVLPSHPAPALFVIAGPRTLPAGEQASGLAGVLRRFAGVGQVPWGRAAWEDPAQVRSSILTHLEFSHINEDADEPGYQTNDNTARLYM